jgi:TetR/AcrR family transcriptional regulator
MSKDITTEAKIKEAAQRVFTNKGFAGCSSREIAKEAGLNVALVNYYFRSKEQLFHVVFHTVMEDFMLSMKDVFRMKQPLETKVRLFIEREYEFITKHPEIPGFIVSEMNRCELGDSNKQFIMDQISETGIFDEMNEAQAKGEMRKIDLVSVTLLMMSNCHFPFIAKGLMQEIHQLDEEKYAQQLILHKQYVIEMMVGYLFPAK